MIRLDESAWTLPFYQPVPDFPSKDRLARLGAYEPDT